MNIKDLFFSILENVKEEKYSDIHLNSGLKPMIRDREGNIRILDDFFINKEEIKLPILSKENIEEIIENITDKDNFEKFKKNFELDFSYKYKEERYRINCYIDSNGYSVAFRTISKDTPSIEELGLGKQVKIMCDKPRGLILVTGPTGSGKTTNLTAMIDYINTKYKRHIITIEDPIEYVHKNKKSLINQREIGTHTKGFSQAIKSSLREDPDVIMIGEMRDFKTIKSALTLAETGHLVLSTLHTNDTPQTIDRVIDIFSGPQQQQVRMQLAMTLIGIVSQRLLPRIDKKGRIACREILLNNDAVKNTIISGKTHQIYSILETGRQDGMILMDKYLIILYKAKVINEDILYTYARDKDIINMMIKDSEIKTTK